MNTEIKELYFLLKWPISTKKDILMTTLLFKNWLDLIKSVRCCHRKKMALRHFVVDNYSGVKKYTLSGKWKRVIKLDGCLIFTFFRHQEWWIGWRNRKGTKFFEAFSNNGSFRDTFARSNLDRSVFVMAAECFLNAGEQVV